MNKLKLFSFAIILVFGFSSAATAQSAEVTVIGSNTVFPIMERQAARFQELNPDVNIAIQGPGSGAGATAVINGQTDIAPMSRAPKDGELKEMAANGVGAAIITIALDALVVIVNTNNPLTGLTIAQISGIFNGTFTKWSDLGWTAGGDVAIVERDENSGTHDYFNEFFLDGEEVDPNDFTSHSQQSSTSLLFELVADNDGAIGYGGLAYLDSTVKALEVDSVAATKNNARDESYPVARPLFLVYDILSIEKAALEFVKYSLSPEGQFLVEDTGYVAVLPALTTLNPNANGFNAGDASSEDNSPFTFSPLFPVAIALPIYIIRKRRN